MSYSIKSIEVFEKQFKRLFKKYPSLKDDIRVLVAQLKINPEQGKALGKNCYKIRLAIGSKKKGKSGGARVIINIVINQNCVYLLTIYDKSEKGNITDNELSNLLQFIPE